jgi:hypothetical protein
MHQRPASCLKVLDVALVKLHQVRVGARHTTKLGVQRGKDLVILRTTVLAGQRNDAV